MKEIDWFQQIKKMVIPPRPPKWGARGRYKREWKSFMAQMEIILQSADRITKSYSSAASANGGLNGLMMGGGNARRWTNFFHSRMQTSEELMSPTLLLHVTECLRHYLIGCRKKNKSNGITSSIQSSSSSINHHHHQLSHSYSSSSNHNEGADDTNIQSMSSIECQAVAEGMLEYITTHCLDVDNSLIGFTVNPSVAGQLTYRRLNSINQLIKEFSGGNANISATLSFANNNSNNSGNSLNMSVNANNGHTSSPNTSNISKLKGAITYQSPTAKIVQTRRSTSATRIIKKPSNFTIVQSNILTKKKSSKSKDLNDPLYMIDLMSRWSKMSDRKLASELREFVQAHHQDCDISDGTTSNGQTVNATDSSYLVKGDLVVFKYPSKDSINQPKYMFGRFTGQICDSPNSPFREEMHSTEYLSIYTNPTETEWIWIKRDDIFKFTNQLKMMEQLTNAQKMGSMVECPTLKLQKIISVKEEELLRNYLSTRSISPGLLDKLENYTVTLKDLKELRSLCVILSQLSSNLPIDLVSNVQRMVAAEVGRFLSTVDISTLYTPTRRTLLEGLERYHEMRGSQLKSRASALRSLCENAVGRLISAKLEILDGTRKLRVVNWWLTLIKEQVEDYLKCRGFNPDAVPADYTVTPPASLKAVADNLVVLHNILPSGCSYDPALLELVRRLKDAIYPVIEDFNSSIRYILCEWLDIEYIEDGADQQQQQIDFNSALGKNLSTLSSDNVTKIKRMIKDSEYLTEMVRLENSISDNYEDARRYETDIIPISGLIFGRLYRIENELRTVIECWHDIDTRRSIRRPVATRSPSKPTAIIIPTTTIVSNGSSSGSGSPSLTGNRLSNSTLNANNNNNTTTNNNITTTTTPSNNNSNNNNNNKISTATPPNFNIPEIVIASAEGTTETLKFSNSNNITKQPIVTV